MSKVNGDNIQYLIGRCGTCRHFSRGNWHPAHGGGEQNGGNCKVICAMLRMTNTALTWYDELYVMETFGCSAYSFNEKFTRSERGE